MTVNDTGIAALNAPHEEPGQTPQADIYLDEPAPLVRHETRQGQHIEHDNDEVEQIGDSHAARMLLRTNQALLEAYYLAKGARVLAA